MGRAARAGAATGRVSRSYFPLSFSLRKEAKEAGDDQLFAFHNAVADVVAAEERVVEEHRAAMQVRRVGFSSFCPYQRPFCSCVQYMREQLAVEDTLLDKVDGVDYDIEEYVHALQGIVGGKLACLQRLQGNRRPCNGHGCRPCVLTEFPGPAHLEKFSKQLRDEEKASKNVKRLNF